jgi:hypothetical protein
MISKTLLAIAISVSCGLTVAPVMAAADVGTSEWRSPQAAATNATELAAFRAELRDLLQQYPLVDTGQPALPTATMRSFSEPAATVAHATPLVTQVALPGTTSAAPVLLVEAAVLKRYLAEPTNLALAQYLAVFHLHQAMGTQQRQPVAALWHSILSQYFFTRSVQLDRDPAWAQHGLSLAAPITASLLRQKQSAFANAGAAHQQFLQAFTQQVSQRPQALTSLLQEVLQAPDNTLTNAYLTAVNLWAGGEAAVEDPAILYHFVLASYFSKRTVRMAEQMEQAWRVDPQQHARFRLAPILGGWAVPARLWLASLHQDQQAKSLLNVEHRAWLAHNAPFHSASVSLMLFNEPQLFDEALAAWESGIWSCADVSANRACGDSPYFSFNMVSYWLSGVDFYLKAGQTERARGMLQARYAPFFQFDRWTLGQQAWLQREQQLDQLADDYQNSDPTDDPTNFLLTRHRWGPDTINCQSCHQQQQRYWTDEEKAQLTLPSEQVATLGKWPVMTTDWTATVLPTALSASADKAEFCQSALVDTQSCQRSEVAQDE